MPCVSGFKFTDQGFTRADFDDFFVRREIFSDGGLWMWGSNQLALLGNNNTIDRSSPVQTVSGGTNWKMVSVDFVSAGIKTDGTLWVWGDDTCGQTGTDSFTKFNRSSPVQTVSSGTDWKSVDVGQEETTVAIKSNGTLWVWGRGGSGQMGNGASTDRSSPVQTIAGGNNWNQAASGFFSVAATKTDGTLWVWGYGSYGRFALNVSGTQFCNSPIQTISQTCCWKKVVNGRCNLMATKTDGTLWVWGRNTGGVLGNNDTINRSSPVQTISSGTNWKDISVGLNHSAAIKTDGTLWLWGCNGTYSLGASGTAARSSPVQTLSGGTNWKFICAANQRSVGIKTDGTLWTWGRDSCGALGRNASFNCSSPAQTIAGGNTWKFASAGVTSYASGAIREDCW